MRTNIPPLAITFLAILLISCEPEVEKEVEIDSELEKTTEEIIKSLYNDDAEIITIDECEYIVIKYTFSKDSYGFMTHKGNCSNPIHVYNEVPELSPQEE